jgi:hypothetical protein
VCFIRELLSSLDRGLATIAIIVGIAGILRADYLFGKLNRRADNMTERFLGEALTTLVSYAAFAQAMQGIDLFSFELPKDGAFALLTAFHLQKILHAKKLSPEQLTELRQKTRNQVTDEAKEQAKLLIKSKLGKLKEGVEFGPGSKS